MEKENNWRGTLFVWDGILSLSDKEEKTNDDDVIVEWHGTWVGYDSVDASNVPTPKRGAFDEFVSSEHTFNVEGVVNRAKTTEVKDLKVTSRMLICGDKSFLHHVAMNGGAGYELGEGSDKKLHKDDRHDMYFFSPLRWTGKLCDQVQNMVLALGENEFGSFISVGWLRVGNRVTIARRYVNDTDERAKWDIDDLRSAVFDHIATIVDDENVQLVIPPWQCSAMHADSGGISKRRRKSED